MSKKIFVILGAPGSGKGTRAEIMEEKLGIPHVSTGSVIRQKCDFIIDDKNSNYNYGKLMPDNFVEDLLTQELESIDTSSGYILDGYPRNIEQAKRLDAILESRGETITKVFLFEADLDTIYSRVLSRKVCPECARVYGSLDNISVGDKCLDCNGLVVLRTDDNEETLKNRIDTFFTEIVDIRKYYEDMGVLEVVDAKENASEMLNRI